jgi:predicted PurR-regulated permease PerM
MPTHAGERRAGPRQIGLGAATKAVSERVSSIVRLEIQLAVSELKRKVVALGLGIGLVVGAGIFLLFVLGFAFATIAAAFATFLSTWLALLIVTGILFAIAGALGFVGVTLLAKGTPPLPEQAIEEAKLTTEALKNGG